MSEVKSEYPGYPPTQYEQELMDAILAQQKLFSDQLENVLSMSEIQNRQAQSIVDIGKTLESAHAGYQDLLDGITKLRVIVSKMHNRLDKLETKLNQ